MTTKNIIFTVAAVIIVVGAGAYLLTQKMGSGTNAPAMTTSDSGNQAQGKIVFGITDAATDLNGVSSITATVNKAEIHSAASGWTTISTATNQYDLLALKQSGKIDLLANANVAPGNYDQMRLVISKVVVVKDGVAQEAKLPSGELKINGNITVAADKTVSVVFDVMADKSLHVTGNGKFIFAPVLKVKQQTGVSVEFKANNEISITGGNNEGDENFGMDEKGEVKSNFELQGDLNIDANDVITFILRADGIQDVTRTIDTHNVNNNPSCQQQATPIASISAQVGSQISGQCLWNGRCGIYD